MHSLALRLLAIVGPALVGCSFALNFDADQCSSNADCSGLGSAVCSMGTCVAATDGAAGASGASSSASASELLGNQGSDDDEAMTLEGGAGGSGAQGDAGAAEQAGASTGCTSTEQCVADNLDEPYVCTAPGAECLSLKTAECPLVFGEYNDDDSIVVGAFLDIPAAAPLSQMSVLNVKLALKEFNESVGGLPGGPLGALRPLAMVVCRNDPELMAAGAKHLIENVGVSAVLAHLPSAELKTLFVDHALPNDTFVLNPGFADNSLTSLSSGGLFWHVIGDVRDVAPAYVPLLARIETYLNLGMDEELRVAMLVADRYAEKSIADTMASQLQFNGRSALDNGDNFYSATVPAMADDPSADYSEVNVALSEFSPHVVIAVTRDEFVYKILPVLEEAWPVGDNAPPRPFYVLPTALSANTDLLDFISLDGHGTTSADKQRRFVGVAPEAPEDLTLYNKFLVRFITEYPEFENPGGLENFYDAVYLLANAMFAAGSVAQITGSDIARGMQRIVSGPVSVDVGPTSIADGFSALAAGGNIRINGTMGPADFDPGVGARRGQGSIYCFAQSGFTLTFAYDVLRYDSSSDDLVGDFTCFSGF